MGWVSTTSYLFASMGLWKEQVDFKGLKQSVLIVSKSLHWL